MFVIMGATGQVGGAVVEVLRRRGAAVRALTRHPDRAAGLCGGTVEVARADTADTTGLTSAFSGAEAAFVMVVPPPSAADVLAAGRAASVAIAAAVRAGRVPHVVALSSAGAQLAEGSGIVRILHDFERELTGSAPSVVFLRAGDFMENWAAMLPVAREAGILPSAKMPLEARSGAVSVLDVAQTAAELLHEPRRGTRIVNLEGPAGYSALDAAAILTKLLGKPVAAVPMSRDETVAGLRAIGASDDYASKIADLNDAINAGRMSFLSGSDETRRGTVTLEDALQRLVGKAGT